MTPNPTAPETFCFHMVMAEVIFRTGQDVQSRRIQFFAKGLDNTFPAHRLQQIQNTAAVQIRHQLPKKLTHFDVLDVLLHTLHPLGSMTDEEFYGTGNVPGAAEELPTQLPAEEAESAPADASNNVVPITGKTPE